MEEKDEILSLADDFASCKKILTAIGDETRQYIIIEMMKIKGCYGSRVGEITKRINLSRPAISHHLQILKDAGIIKMRREGTRNYYYFDSEMEALAKLISTLQKAREIAKKLPDRSVRDE